MTTTKRLFGTASATLLLFLLPAGCNKEAKAASRLSAATEYFSKAAYPAAEIEYKNVLALEPGNPGALKGLGLTLVRQGAMLDAAQVLSNAKTRLPTDDEVGINLARALLELSFLTDSRSELLAVLDRNPAHGEALMLLAETSTTPEAMDECAERITRSKAGDQTTVLLASALLELRRGEIDAGTKLVARAVAADPTSAPALALQGNLLKADKQPEKALEALSKASELAGPRSTERGFHALFLAELGRQKEAIELLKAATAAAPDYLPNWRLLARLALAAGNDAEATEALSKVLAKSSLDIEAGMLQTQLWLRAKQPAKAIELLEKLDRTFPSRVQVEMALAKAYLASSDFSKATAQLDRVLTKAPGAIEAIELRSVIHLKDGQAAEAIQLLEPLHAAQPKNRQAQDLLVGAYRAVNRPADAIAILKSQAEAAPEDLRIKLQLGQLLHAQGQTAEARVVFGQALKQDPDNIGAVAQLAALDQKDGKSEDALARVEAYLAAHPEAPEAHLLKASHCFAAKDYKTAEASATKAIELKPDNPAAYGLLLRIQILDNRLEEAATRLRQLVATNPTNLAARMYLGSLLRELGHLEEARVCFAEIVSSNPKFGAAYNDLAYIDSEIPGHLDQAWTSACKARELLPDDPAVSDTCGWIEWLRGNYRQALPFLVEAAGHLPDDATIQYHLAMARYMMHQIPEAIAAFDKALASATDFPGKDQAVAHLAVLREGGKLDLASLEKQVVDSPKDVVLMVLKAGKLTAAGRAEDALASYQQALTINPDLEAAHLGLAELYATTLKQPAKALEAANQARKLAPNDPRAASVLGTLNFNLGKHQEAYDLLHEAARKLPDDPALQYDYAWAAYSVGQVADAREVMTKLAPADPARATEIHDFLALTAPDVATAAGTPALIEQRLVRQPDDVPSLMARAALQEKQDGENPAPTYARVLEIFPRFDPARIALARVYLDDPKQLASAEELANAARERLPNDPDLSGILAIINFRKGQFDYAAQLLKELATKRPLTGRELFALGISQAATKHPDEARQNLTQALLTKLPPADAAKAKASLAELDKPDGEGEK